MGLIFRTSSLANTGATQVKDAPLTYQEGDGNFAWLATNLSGSVVSISGSVSLNGSLSIPTLTSTAQSNVITVDTATGQLYYTASSTVGSAAISTGSFVTTGSVTNNVLTFTKGDSSTFSLTVDTGSAATVNTGSFMITGSVAGNILTFTKGDSTTFNLTVSATGGPISVTSSTLYSNDPLTGDLSSTGSVAFGIAAGSGSTGAFDAIFIGSNTGNGATNAAESVFIGKNAGRSATQATSSFFLGERAGYLATYANNSVFLGTAAGFRATSGSNSIAIGNGAGANGIGNTIGDFNIIIGTQVTIPNNQRASLNIGGLIFGTGSYDGTAGSNFSGSVNGNVGINQPTPIYNLDVSGSLRVTDTARLNSSVQVGTVLTLSQLDPLPTPTDGNIAVSASNLYFASASAWHQVQLI